MELAIGPFVRHVAAYRIEHHHQYATVRGHVYAPAKKSLGFGLFRIHKRESDAVKEEIAGRKDNDFEQAFQEATKNNFGFLSVRLQAKSPSEKYWSSFTKRILFD